MKQIIMEGPRKSRIAEVSVPAISGAQILVKVTLTGMCHSEWYPVTHRDNLIKGAVRCS